LVIDYQNTGELLKILISFSIGLFSFASGLYAYLKKKGIKLASFDKVIEYRQLKDIVYALTENISKDEFLNIVNFVVEIKKDNKPITKAVVEQAGIMLFDAITTEENEKTV